MSGVPVWRVQYEGASNQTVTEFVHDRWAERCEGDTPGQWFPEPVASRLIDPDDPQVRERIADVFHGRGMGGAHDLADAILAALKMGAPE